MKTIVMLVGLSLVFVPDGLSTTNRPLLSPSAQETVVVSGVVTDFLTKAGVARAQLVFEGTEHKQMVLSGNDGNYEAQLPSDDYRISVRRMTYCSSRRAAVHLESDTKFNFILLPCAIEEIGIITDGRYKGEATVEVNPLSFDSLHVPSKAGSGGELLLRFGTKRDGPRFVEYEGAMLKYAVRDGNSKDVRDDYKYVGVMATYRLFTVYGDKVKLVSDTFEFNAEGNVIVEDGHNRTEANAVRVRFEEAKPLIEFVR